MLLSEANLLGIGGGVMLGGICHGGRTWLTIGVGTTEMAIIHRLLFFLFVGMDSITHTNIITPNVIRPNIANTFHRVIKFESYEMNRLLHRKLKIEPHNPTITWG